MLLVRWVFGSRKEGTEEEEGYENAKKKVGKGKSTKQCIAQEDRDLRPASCLGLVGSL